MGSIINVLLIIGGAVLAFLVCKSAISRSMAVPRNIEKIERQLSQAGFVVSRKIGGEGNKASAHYMLYVDDVNKKWLLTSPFSTSVNKIREFRDLIDYEFFDVDGSDIMGKIGRGIGATMGVIGGAAVGGLVGGVVGGVGVKKATSILPGMRGESHAYGLALQTTDCNANNPVLIFDFRKVATEDLGNAGDKFLTLFDKATKSGISRTSFPYKKDIAAIQKMASVFDYILTSNAQNN